MKKRYRIASPDTAVLQTLVQALNCQPAIAAVLANRHILSPKEALSFFSNDLKHIRSPWSIKDMNKAVLRISKALEKGENILIFGDYDVDGVTATALFYDFLRKAGATATYYIPHRSREGYGLKEAHIHRIAVPKKIDLIITVDCGVGSHNAVNAARKVGIDVVITDHHQISPPLPAAEAVVDPNRPDCDAGFGLLAGVGVVYAVLICLRKHLRDNKFWESRPEPNLKVFSDLVALGTVADIVPLRKENRLFTKTGLQLLRSDSRPGLKALRSAAGLASAISTSEDIAFRLAPRINAAGRIAHAVCAVKLLTTRNEKKAQRIAGILNRLNEKRRATEQEILSQVLQYINANPSVLQRNAIILKHPDWHEGVLGIVAAKLVDRFYRPTALISIRNGVGKGSARSIPGFHLYKGLEEIRDYLDDFGGHAMAAGFRIRADRIDAFRDSFDNIVSGSTQPDDFIPAVAIDRELSFDEITPTLVEELETLQPFGQDNPEPVFMTRNVRIVFSRIVGIKHRRMRLKQSQSSTGIIFDAIQFNINPDTQPPTFLKQVAFRIRWNRWNGQKTIQLVIEAT